MRPGAVLITLMCASPLAAQGPLPVPADWRWTTDAAATMAEGQEPPPGTWRFVQMPPGWHLTTTTVGARLFPRDRSVSGRFAVEVEAFLFPVDSSAHWGLALTAPDDESVWWEFVVRGDGGAAIVGHHGDRATVLQAWKADSAIVAQRGSELARNRLRVEGDGRLLRFSVNGAAVATLAAAGLPDRYLPGLRVTRGVNLHLIRYDLVTPLAPLPASAPGGGAPLP